MRGGGVGDQPQRQADAEDRVVQVHRDVQQDEPQVAAVPPGARTARTDRAARTARAGRSGLRGRRVRVRVLGPCGGHRPVAGRLPGAPHQGGGHQERQRVGQDQHVVGAPGAGGESDGGEARTEGVAGVRRAARERLVGGAALARDPGGEEHLQRLGAPVSQVGDGEQEQQHAEVGDRQQGAQGAQADQVAADQQGADLEAVGEVARQWRSGDARHPGRAEQQAQLSGVESDDEGEVEDGGRGPHAGARAVQRLGEQHDPCVTAARRPAQLRQQPGLPPSWLADLPTAPHPSPPYRPRPPSMYLDVEIHGEACRRLILTSRNLTTTYMVRRTRARRFPLPLSDPSGRFRSSGTTWGTDGHE